MAQKVIDIVGASKESFAKAAENAVAEAAKTINKTRYRPRIRIRRMRPRAKVLPNWGTSTTT